MPKLTPAQQVIQKKLRILNIAHTALQNALPAYEGFKAADVRRDADDMTINIWATLEGESVRRMFQVKVKEVR